LKTRLIAALSWLILICFLTLTSGNKFPKNPKLIPHIDKMVHFLMFFILLILWILAIGLDNQNKIKRNVLMVVGVLGTILACLLEYLQKFIPYRSFDLLDMSMNIFGVVCGVLCFHFIHKKYSLDI